MKNIIKWIFGYVKDGNGYLYKYIVVCMKNREKIENTDYSAMKVFSFDSLNEARSWIKEYVAKADRNQYVIYKLLKEEE